VAARVEHELPTMEDIHFQLSTRTTSVTASRVTDNLFFGDVVAVCSSGQVATVRPAHHNCCIPYGRAACVAWNVEDMDR
jgi:hypothetical protein